MFYKLTKVGNSVGVTIPKKLLKLFGLEVGEEVILEPDMESRTITIKPVSVAEDEVNKSVKEGMHDFVKRYPTALKNLSKR